MSRRTGIPVPTSREPGPRDRVGFPALATRESRCPTLLLGLMSFAGLLLTYGLNTWLPQIMGEQGYGKDYALAFLLVLNLGAIVGGLVASYVAGPRRRPPGRRDDLRARRGRACAAAAAPAVRAAARRGRGRRRSAPSARRC